MTSVNFIHSAATININAPLNSLIYLSIHGRDRGFSQRRGGESLSPSSAGFISKYIPAACHILKKFYITIPMWTWPVCPHTWMHAVPTDNRWLCWSCLQVYSSIYLILSFTHHLMFGEEFIHLSASGPSQGFQR